MEAAGTRGGRGDLANVPQTPEAADRSPATAGLLAAGMIVFGSATPVSRIVSQTAPPFVGGLLRVALGTALLGALAFGRRGEIARLTRADWLAVVGIAVFGMFGFSAFMLFGMRLAPGAVGATVMGTTPAVTALAAMAFMGERPTWRKLTAVALAAAGAVVLRFGGGLGGGDGGTGVALGALLVFAAVCCEAAYTLLGRRVSQRIYPVLAAALGAALSLPLFAVAAAFQWGDFAPSQMDARAWWALGWFGLGTLGLGSWLWYRGVARVSGVTAAAFMGLMPLSALGLSYLLLDEPFRWAHLAGFGVVFASVLLMSWEHARMSRNDS